MVSFERIMLICVAFCSGQSWGHALGACGCIDINERRVIPDIEIRDAIINACGLRSISEFQLLTLERRKSVIREVMLSLDVRPRQLSRVTGMNYETIRNILGGVFSQHPPRRILFVQRRFQRFGVGVRIPWYFAYYTLKKSVKS